MPAIEETYYFDKSDDWKIAIPTQGLVAGSLTIEKTGQENPSELYRVMQKVAQFWERKGIRNYLIYTSSEEKGWEMVPVKGDNASFWDRTRAFMHQLGVMYRVTFGRYALSSEEKKGLYTEYSKLTSFQAKKTGETVQRAVKDAFCQEKVIDSQLIWEGKHVRVLYNYAPIGKEGIHFLLVPKNHKERFSQLTQDEFSEIQTFAQTLMQKYPDHLCYRYNKTGQLAGQTVPHFHEHVVFVLPQHDFWGKLSVFFRMITPPSPLSSEELSKRVTYYKALVN